MNTANKRKLFSILIGALLSVGALNASAAPAPSGPPDATVPFDADLACTFPLTVELWDGNGHTRLVTDKDGFPKFVFSGTGNTFRFTNATTGQSTIQMSQGAHQQIIQYPDGSLKVTSDGALLVVWFPTDIPAGPSTTYYNGHSVLAISAAGVGTWVTPPRGHARDICAELS